MGIDYLTPTKSARVRALLSWLGLAAVLAFAHPAARFYATHVSPLSACDQVPWARAALLLTSSLLLIAAVLMARSAWRVYVYRQYPAPDSYLLFRTKIQRGLGAALYGVSFFASSVAFLVLLGYLILSDTFKVIFLGAASCGA